MRRFGSAPVTVSHTVADWEGGMMTSTTTTIVVPDFDDLDDKAATKAINAIGKATVETWEDVVREQVGPLYAPTTDAHDAIRTMEAKLAATKAMTLRLDVLAGRTVMAVRRVAPKATNVKIGRAVEGDDADRIVGEPGTPEHAASKKKADAFRKRWGNYSAAAKAAATRAERVAVDANVPTVSVRDALTLLQTDGLTIGALQDFAATDAPVSSVKAGAAERAEAKAKRDAEKESTPPAYADVMDATEALADLIRANVSRFTTEERANLLGVLDRTRGVLTRTGK